MADAYWRYGDGRQQQQPQPQPTTLHSHTVKRPRSDLEMPGSHDLSSYYPHDNDRAGTRVVRDTDSINASYDRYLRSAQMSAFGNDSGRSLSSGPPRHLQVDDPRGMAMGASEAVLDVKTLPVAVERKPERSLPPERPLPPDASSTLFVEGLPANCTRREVSHIFRPFVGYKEVRLVTKESRHPGGDPLVLCFVDFQSPAHAATAMDALQGYKFDEHDRDSSNLRLQFARYPGARSGGGHRGKR
ncbi:nuclear speckle RNA-binding protein A-like [Andrographis paniculata]|uniref:nuclear speckle RNA-binding protein A-like n=1 Tax=Andrographis paniculata TaxID=175694 RepID=UPI0021E9A789|nr:nuclear speckle RNA-binding protein A-like [Andrographis paniculata]